MHRPDPDTDIDETLSALSDLVHSGKVRAIGSCTFPAEQIVEAQWVADRRGYVRFRCEQPPYSIFVRGIEANVLPACQKYGMGVIAWSPLAGGWLTGRIRRDTGVDMTRGRAQRIPQRFDPTLPGNIQDSNRQVKTHRPCSDMTTPPAPSVAGGVSLPVVPNPAKGSG